MSNDKEVAHNGFKPQERRAFRFNKKTWDRESSGLGGRMASDKSARWRSLDASAQKERERVPRNTVKYSNGIEALVHYHQADSGE
jgi:hypothetical protein